MAFKINVKRYAKETIHPVKEIKALDSEMAGYVDFLATEERIEPGALIDTCARMLELAEKREILVKVITTFTEYRTQT